MRRPSGAESPVTMQLGDGTPVDLHALAEEVCARFYARYPSEHARSGDAGIDWCRHDNQYLLAWAIQEARDGTVSVAGQALWLAGVLDARGFPLELLAGDLDVAADLVRSREELGEVAHGAADALAAAARAVRGRIAEAAPVEPAGEPDPLA